MSWRKAVRSLCGAVFGRQETLHRIPFGQLRGRYLLMSPEISPRMYFGIDEPYVARLARQYAAPGDVIYDVGAHIGYTTLLFADRLQGDGEVHAFEILPSVARQYLSAAVEANRLTNVFVHEVGLSDKPGAFDLRRGPTAMASLYFPEASGPAEACKVVRLDDFIENRKVPPPSIIKIDIEGAEVDCLRGALQTIRLHRPVMFIEFHSKELLLDGIEFLRTLQYVVKGPGGARIDDASSIARLAKFHETVLCAPASEQAAHPCRAVPSFN